MPRSCCTRFFNRIPEDEPVFTLAARDKCAIPTLKEWIKRAEIAGVNPFKIDVAKAHLRDFERFSKENPDIMKVPD
jgi:hypothetical protein